MTKRQARSKAKRPKAKSAKPKGPKVSTSGAIPMSLDDHLESIKSVAAAFDASGGEKGACLVSDPQTGENRCLRTDPATCKALGGTFIGGPCGG